MAVTEPRVTHTVHYERRHAAHTAHLLGTIVTLGLWAPVWLGRSAYHRAGAGRRVETEYHYSSPVDDQLTGPVEATAAPVAARGLASMNRTEWIIAVSIAAFLLFCVVIAAV